MEQFTYRAYDSGGVLKEGGIAAVDMASAKAKLKDSGLIPVDIFVKKEQIEGLSDYFTAKINPGIKELEFFSSQISMLLKNGIKIDKAIQLSRKGIKNKKFLSVIDTVNEKIRHGINLSDALAEHTDIFDTFFISIVKTGETSGELPRAFADLADSLAFKRQIIAKTQQALLYPSIIMFVCIAAVFFIFNFIVPRFEVVFSGMKNLPVYTQFLMDISAFVRNYQFFLIGGFFSGIIVLVRFKKSNIVKNTSDYLLVNVPIVKKISYNLENLRFVSTLSILLSNGVVISDAIKHAVDSVGNVFIRRKLEIVKKEVRQGNKLSDILNKTGFLSEKYDGMVETGEQTGKMGEIFRDMEKRMKMDYEISVSSMITILEPLLILIMSFIVGTVIIVMLMSMVSINDIDF